MLILVLAGAITVSAQSADQEYSLFRLAIRNRSGQIVHMSMVGREIPYHYQISVPSGESRAFSIRKGVYDQLTTACGRTAAGTLQVTRQVRLVFTPCSSRAANSGAPAIEKIHIDDSPQGISWFFRYNPFSLSAFAPASGSGVVATCQLDAASDVTIYYRPSTQAEVFSIQPAGFTQQLYARTGDGWLGFDPGVAQAANIGSFRLRWVAPGTQTISGACNSLPVVWGPPPGICFDQPMETTNIYASPDASSEVLTQLEVGEFAAITGVTSDGDWLSVDLGPGNTGLTITGWAPGSTANVNGPCDDLPVVTP